MNLANSLAFLFLGSAMEILPSVFPGWFPSLGIDGTSARTLWVHLMGWVEIGISGAFGLQNFILPLASRLLTASSGAVAPFNPKGAGEPGRRRLA